MSLLSTSSSDSSLYLHPKFRQPSSAQWTQKHRSASAPQRNDNHNADTILIDLTDVEPCTSPLFSDDFPPCPSLMSDISSNYYKSPSMAEFDDDDYLVLLTPPTQYDSFSWANEEYEENTNVADFATTVADHSMEDDAEDDFTDRLVASQAISDGLNLLTEDHWRCRRPLPPASEQFIPPRILTKGKRASRETVLSVIVEKVDDEQVTEDVELEDEAQNVSNTIETEPLRVRWAVLPLPERIVSKIQPYHPKLLKPNLPSSETVTTSWHKAMKSFSSVATSLASVSSIKRMERRSRAGLWLR